MARLYMFVETQCQFAFDAALAMLEWSTDQERIFSRTCPNHSTVDAINIIASWQFEEFDPKPCGEFLPIEIDANLTNAESNLADQRFEKLD